MCLCIRSTAGLAGNCDGFPGGPARPSCLNRTHPNKQGTTVLAVASSTEEIKKAFEPFDEITLRSGTGPNLLYEGQGSLSDFGVFMPDDVEAFARVYFNCNVTPEAPRPWRACARAESRGRSAHREESQSRRPPGLPGH